MWGHKSDKYKRKTFRLCLEVEKEGWNKNVMKTYERKENMKENSPFSIWEVGEQGKL